jgi:hypothetical protein
MDPKKTAATKNLSAPVLLASIMTAAAFFPFAVFAQTVLSPTPFVPFPDRAGFAVPAALTAEEDQTEYDEKQFHIPLMLNESVEGQIEYFTTRARSVFQSWLDRSAKYTPMMKKIFREQNLPEDLVYVAMIESGFNPHAVSPKKAVGCWQFLRATAREYGLNADHWVDERKDPVKSTRAAAAFFRDLYNTFGSWPLVLASYNAGAGRMQGAVQKAGSGDYWELRTSRFIHVETRDYVPRYMAAMVIAKNPVAYGFRAPRQEPLQYDEVLVQKSTDLRRIARYAGISYKEIQELNPELLQSVTPRAPYVLRLPAGTRSTYQQQLVKASVRERKIRAEREKAQAGGLLFTKLISGNPLVMPDRVSPAIVSPFGALLDVLHGFSGRHRESVFSSSVPGSFLR